MNSLFYLERLDADDEQLLRLAWERARPSKGRVYYSLPLRSGEISGERPWLARWEQIRANFDFTGRRVLELGSNMGLLSSFALMTGAASAVAVDRDEIVLRAGQVVASAFGVFPVFVHCAFEDPVAWEDELLRHDPDVLCMFNVYQWVADQPRLLRFCSRFREMLIEDHDPFEVVEERYRALGFHQITLFGESELGRPLVHLTRNSA